MMIVKEIKKLEAFTKVIIFIIVKILVFNRFFSYINIWFKSRIVKKWIRRIIYVAIVKNSAVVDRLLNASISRQN